MFFKTDAPAGSNLYLCTALNTWTQLTGAGGGGGDNVSVNGTAVTDANLNDSTPSAPSGSRNVRWQRSGSSPDSVSAYVEPMVGATSGAAGQAGLVPAPAAGQQDYCLRGNGTWTVCPTDGGGGSFDPSATYDLSGVNKVNSLYVSIYLQNHSTTGTALYRTVCVASDGRASQCVSGNVARAIGICMEGCGTTGNARIAIAGQMTCDFDGSVTAGNWVTVSTSQPGKCADAGTTKPAAPLGIVLVTQSGQGSYDIVKGIQ